MTETTKCPYPFHGHLGPHQCEHQLAEARASLGIEPRPAPGYVIEIDFICQDDAKRAYEAIEKLLAEMGQIGTISMRNCDNE